MLRKALLALVALAIGCGPTTRAVDPQFQTFAAASANDTTILNAIGPNVYPIGTYDALVKSRVNTGAPYTTGLNAQAVAVVKAKLNGTPYVSAVGFGDSVTLGSTDTDATNGYRQDDTAALIAVYGASIPFEWRGPNHGGFATLPLQYSNGVGGRTCADALSRVTLEVGPGSPIETADIGIVMFGVNDSRHNIDTPTFIASMKSYVLAIHARIPAMVFVLAYTTELPSDPSHNAVITLYHDAMPGLRDDLVANGCTVFLASGSPGLVLADMNPTQMIHPSYPAGYAKLAATLSSAILAATAATGKL